jgi:hypothetical protein
MNIKLFKEGEIITRNEPMVGKYDQNGCGDSSYCGERIILKGHDPVSKIIFFETPDEIIKDIHDLSYARDAWDEGWCYYPETLWQKIKKAVGNLSI